MKRTKHIKTGRDCFVSIFRSQAPVDKIIISLGTNDLQLKYNKSHKDIISDLIWYKHTVENIYIDEDDRKKYFVDKKMPEFIYILPFNFDYKVNASVIFDEGREKERVAIVKEFKKYAGNVKVIALNDIPLFDDGIHLNYEGNNQLAKIIMEEL